MRSKLFITVAAAVALLVLSAVGVYAYDTSGEDQVAAGVKVGGVAIGGLGRSAARARLRAQLLDPLHADVVVRARGHRFTLTAQRAKVAADIDAMVDEAIARGRAGNVLTRTVRGLTGGDVDADLEPRVTYDKRAVQSLVKRVRDTVNRDPRDAKIAFTASGIDTRRSRTGLRLRADKLRGAVIDALLQPDRGSRTVTAQIRRVRPKVTTAALAKKYDTLISINRGAFTLRLYKHLKLVKRYGIAVGQVGLETPAGMYEIQNKAVNPAWSVPNSDWAGDLAGTVVPGGAPDNPLKARWMGIYNGAGIHGTDARGSIGSNASHGCIRMLVEDVIELYDEVPVGAPVYIA